MAPEDIHDGVDGSPDTPDSDDARDRIALAGRYLAKLSAQKRLIAIITVAGLLAGTAYAFLATPIYRSTATVLVKPVGVDLNKLGPKDPSKLLNLETESQLVVSTDVVNAAEANLPVGTSTAGLLSHIKVAPVKTSATMEISYEGPSGANAAAIATAFADAYLSNRGANAANLVQSQVETLNADKAAALEEVLRLNKVVASSAKGSVAAADARSAIDQAKQRRSALQAQIDAVQLDNVVPGEIIHPARSGSRVSPNRPLDVAGSLVLALLLAVAVALVLDVLDPRVREREVLEKALGAPLLTVIPPADKTTRIGEVLAFDHPNDPVTEAVRALRAAVVAAFPDGGTILIASSLPGEGKSTVASNLAAVLAQADHGVVLISADLRKPRVHEIFKVPNRVGLSSILSRGVPAPDVLANTHSPNLLVCPAGPLPDKPAEMLQSEGMRELILTLRSAAEFVILDCPPVLAVSDTLGLVPLADGVIFVVDSGSTKRTAVKEATYRLRQVEAPILGGVLNRLSPSGGVFSYSFGYGYGPADTARV